MTWIWSPECTGQKKRVNFCWLSSDLHTCVIVWMAPLSYKYMWSPPKNPLGLRGSAAAEYLTGRYKIWVWSLAQTREEESMYLSIVIFDYVYLFMCTHHKACVGKPEVNLYMSVLSFHHLGLGGPTRVIGLGNSAFTCWAILPVLQINMWKYTFYSYQ